MTRSFRPHITRILVELGETNMRCAILDDGALRDIKIYKLEDYTSMGHAIDSYCKDVSFTREARMGLLMAIAPQPKDGVYHFKYRPSWDFKPRELMHELGLASIHILNDLESHAYAVLGGATGETLFKGTPRTSEGPIAVIAPGTGLGFAYVYPDLKHVQQTFGAHMHFHGLGNKDPFYDSIQGKLLFASTSFEDIISGPGLKLLREMKGEKQADEYFARVFGLFIHNCIFFAHAVGGVVITGGLIPALLKEGKLDWNLVREGYAVDTIPAATSTLEDTPWTLIDDPHLGLKGLLAWADINIDS